MQRIRRLRAFTGWLINWGSADFVVAAAFVVALDHIKSVTFNPRQRSKVIEKRTFVSGIEIIWACLKATIAGISEEKQLF